MNNINDNGVHLKFTPRVLKVFHNLENDFVSTSQPLSLPSELQEWKSQTKQQHVLTWQE